MGISWGRIIIEIALLIVLAAVVMASTFLYQSPMITPPIVPPSSSYCLQPPFLDPITHVGVVNVKASPSDTTGEDIGLSDGKFAFNIVGTDGVVKCQASQALNQSKVKDAESFWTKALGQQSNDAEVLIYQENQRVLDTHLPYMTIIVGAVTTGSAASSGLDVLQGVYTAQRTYNQQHQNAMQIRLLIANFGNQQANASKVAQQIIAAAANDQQHIRAMIGLPALADTADVIGTLSRANFPIVLPNSSTSSQEEGGNFFHIAASTIEQGQQAAKYVEQNCPNASDEERPFDCVGQNIAVFLDVGDRYSSSLGQAFVTQLLNDKGVQRTNKIVSPIYYKSMDTNSITDKVRAFGDSPPDLIYFAGSAVDADTLLQSLPSTPNYVNLRILGGDALYRTGSYRAGEYHHLNFTSFAYPDVWEILGRAQNKPSFFCDYAEDFAGGIVDAPVCNNWPTTTPGRRGYSYSRPENDVILSHDALAVVLKGIELSGADGIPSRAQLLTGIRNINGTQAFEGASGRISFGPNGNPVNKAIMVLRVNPVGFTRLQKVYGTF